MLRHHRGVVDANCFNQRAYTQLIPAPQRNAGINISSKLKLFIYPNKPVHTVLSKNSLNCTHIIDKFVKRLFAVIYLLFATYLLPAQTETSATLLSVNEGLSQGMIFDLEQSRDGFIWIATKDGLNRYDGSRFKVFSPDPFNPHAIAGSEVTMLFEDSRGWLWVVTAEGLDIYDPVSGLFYHVYHDGKPLVNYWGRVVETPDGTIWFSDDDQIWKIKVKNDMLLRGAVKDKAIVSPDCKSISMVSVSGWKGSELRAGELIYSSNKKLLVGTNHGIFRLNTSKEQLEPELPMTDWSTRCMIENERGEILAKGITPDNARNWVWIKGSNVQHYRDPSKILYSSSNFNIDREGFLWTFRDRAIQKWRLPALFGNGKPELEINADSIFLNDRAYCTSFMFDKSGVGWIGLNGYGVYKINQKIPKFKSFLQRQSHRQVLECPDGGLISLEKPLVKYPDKNFVNEEVHADFFVNLSPEKIAMGRLAVCFDRQGNGWSSFIEDGLLYRTDAITHAKRSFPWKGAGLIFDRLGKLLSVGEDGLYQFDPQTETSKTFPFAKPQKRVSEYAQFLYEDAQGIIWIFGFRGLIKASPQTRGYRYEYFINNPSDRSSLSANVVLSVADDPLEPVQYLWVGTKGGGLNRMDKKTGKFKQYKTEQGLPDNVIYGVLAENQPTSNTSKKKTGQHIWFSTNKGLCRFDVSTERTKNFKASDGLQDNEFNSSSYLKTKNGTMIFGGVKGLTVFHPDSLRFNENIPQIQIVNLQVNNQPASITPGHSVLNFSYDQNLLTFDFAALEFTQPNQNQYRYQLVGVDKDWVALGNKNSIQFANLAPGTYTFKVEGSNNDGTWSQQAASLQFTIRPPWWASWWAIGFYALSLILIAQQYYQQRLQKNLDLQETKRLREMDEFKSKFFTNITHEFRTPLTVMLGMSEQLARDEVDESKHHKIGLIKRSGENLLRLINQILDLSKLESQSLKINYSQGDVLVYLRYITESMSAVANAQNIMLRVESDQISMMMDFDKERLLQIVHNLLSNAIKFTPSGGKVMLNTSQHDKWFHLSVQDSGVGIEEAELPHLFERFFQAKNQDFAKAGGSGIGLSLTRELVRAMGGEISVQSKPGLGSTFLVKLPITHNAPIEDTANNIGLLKDSWFPSISQTGSNKLADGAEENLTTAGAHVLIIEDNADVMEYIRTCLKDRYVMDFAYNGQAGIDFALDNIPDVIVSDVMMPLKDGFDVVDTLKNDERTSHIPIVLLTAKADVQSRLKGLRKGADHYIAKPFQSEELGVILENLMESRRKLQLKYGQKALFPESIPDIEEVDLDDGFLTKIYAIVEANYRDEEFGLMQLCQKTAMSRSQLFRKLKALTNMAPSDLIRKHRLNHAKKLLESGKTTVAETTWKVGFKDPSYFSKLYQEEFGVAPSATRK